MSFYISLILLDPAESGKVWIQVRLLARAGPLPRAEEQNGAVRSWLGGRGRGWITGAELAARGRGAGELQGLRVPGPPPPRRSFV